MSAADPSEADGGRVERLRALVDEARAAGRLDELAGALETAAAEARAAGGAPVVVAAGEAIPTHFGMVGESPAMQRVYALLEKVAPADVAVLIQGETGTGKELVARAMHDYSPRKDRPFLAENCAAVPAELLESELFGHKKGSFTGAVLDRPGHFVAADGGTVFLDEIGDMPLRMQSKLLRVLQDGEVRPVGSNVTRKVDVRIVAATNKNLKAMCAEKTFREDLYFRLNVIAVELPPLRDRKGDVRLLAQFYLGRYGEELGLETTITEDALAALESWRWPGNVRELQNEIQRSVALSGGAVTMAVVSPQISGAS